MIASLLAWWKRRSLRKYTAWLRDNKVILPQGKTLWERTRELERR